MASKSQAMGGGTLQSAETGHRQPDRDRSVGPIREGPRIWASGEPARKPPHFSQAPANQKRKSWIRSDGSMSCARRIRSGDAYRTSLDAPTSGSGAGASATSALTRVQGLFW